MGYFHIAVGWERNGIESVEAFYMGAEDIASLQGSDRDEYPEPGWYVWACFPGCLPDSDPIGPFESESEARAAWQEMNE